MPQPPLTADQRALVEANLGLAYFFVKKYASRLSGHHYHDLESAALFGLCLAARHYRPEIALFSTFAYHVIRRRIRTMFHNLSQHGFSGLGRSVCKRPVSLATPYFKNGSDEATVGDTVASTSDYATWSVDDTFDPSVLLVKGNKGYRRKGLPLLRKQTDDSLPAGVRRVKGNAYQARYWFTIERRSINLGLYTPAAYGGHQAAIAAAAKAYRVFVRDVRPGVPGHDVADTLAKLQAVGIIPANVAPPRPKRERVAA